MTLMILQVSTGQKMQTIWEAAGNHPLTSVCVMSDGRLVSSSSDYLTRIYTKNSKSTLNNKIVSNDTKIITSIVNFSNAQVVLN